MNTRFDLNLVKTLIAVLEERSVTKAAQRLNLSQPAVSAQLNKLREHFNDPLIITGNKTVTPTEKASLLLPDLKQALAQLNQTIDQHQVFEPANAELTITMASTDYLQASVITPLIQKLRAEAPNIQLSLTTLDFANLSAQIEKQELDLIFMCPTQAPSDLKVKHLFTESYTLIARPDHPLVHPDLTLEEYVSLDHLVVSLRDGTFFTPIDKALQKRGLKRKASMTVSSFLLMPDIVLSTDLVALVPTKLIQHRLADFSYAPCPVDGCEFNVGMLWHERNQRSAAHQWLRGFVLENISFV